MDLSFIVFLPLFLCGLIFGIVGFCMSMHTKNKEKNVQKKQKEKLLN